MTLDEVIKVFEAFSKERSDLYEGPAQSTVSDALHYLKVFRDAKNDHLDDFLMKTAGLQRAIDQHMTAIKELDRVKRMYKRELKAANEIRSKNEER
jgi:hypothetical protein